MAQGPQKPDLSKRYVVTPVALLDSVAWRCLSLRARAALQVFQARHNGFNNGSIAVGVKDLAKALGDQNASAASKAIAELIEKGFLECTSPADWPHSKTREYRLTFVSTGQGRSGGKAPTNEFAEWRPAPGARKKFGGARTATRNAISVTETVPSGKFLGAETVTRPTEIRGFETNFQVAETVPLIVNQSPGKISGSDRLEISRANVVELNAAADLDELRKWVRLAIERLGYGGQKVLATSAGIPAPTLCKFQNGRGMPDRFRMELQRACALVISAKEMREMAA